MFGIVAFSFGLREEEPSPCNVKLGEVVRRFNVASETAYVIVAQREVSLALQKYGIRPEVTVWPPTDGSYLDSQAVWERARDYFRQINVTEVIIVAQPFLHLPSIKSMIERDGFTVVNRSSPSIGFDNSDLNTQPWTRSRWAFLEYAVKIELGGKHGKR